LDLLRSGVSNERAPLLMIAITLEMLQRAVAFFALPALVFKRDCSYISIHFSLEIAEISLPIAWSGKSSGDLK
jgi:hypothetical protein